MASNLYVSYVLENFFAIFHSNDPIPTIGYGESSFKIKVENRASLYFDKNQVLPPQTVVWKNWKGASIPFIFGIPELPIISEKGGQIIINDDIFASAFYFLSGWQEKVNEKRDPAGRFLYEYSIQKDLQISNIPVVNIYFDILRTALEQGLGITLNSKFKEPIAFISHDIDEWAKLWQQKVKKSIRNRHWKTLSETLLHRISGKHLHESFDPLLFLQEKYNFNSSFYFLPDNRKFGDYTQADYETSNPAINNFIQSLQSRGNEIGLHGSFYVHANSEKLELEAKSINKPKGYRSHFLKFDIKKMPTSLEKVGIKYDTTLGFPDQIGWRNSCSYPFYLFDHENQCTSSIIEIPLVIMECTLFFEKYLGLDVNQATQKCIELIQMTEKQGGIISFLWHNSAFDPYLYPGWSQVLENVLDYLQQKKISILTGESILQQMASNG
jgi:hypothetical protein